jgi:hypothetical protein
MTDLGTLAAHVGQAQYPTAAVDKTPRAGLSLRAGAWTSPVGEEVHRRLVAEMVNR